MDSPQTIAAGDVVSGLEPNELVEVRPGAPFEAKTPVEGVTLHTQHKIRRTLSAEELAQRVKVRSQVHSFDGGPRVFPVGAEAGRTGIVHPFDPLFAVNRSVVDILPHQVEAVCRGRFRLPRVRFLPAADTGAGKAMMQACSSRNCFLRRTLSKVLIIPPGGRPGQEDTATLKSPKEDFPADPADSAGRESMKIVFLRHSAFSAGEVNGGETAASKGQRFAGGYNPSKL